VKPVKTKEYYISTKTWVEHRIVSMKKLAYLSFLAFLAFLNPPQTIWFLNFLFFLFFLIPRDENNQE
jgi:hypothetical protein